MAVDYLRSKGIPDLIDEALASLLKERPVNAAQFFLSHFQEVVDKENMKFVKGASIEIVNMLVRKEMNGKKGKIMGKQNEVALSMDNGERRSIATTQIRNLGGHACILKGDTVEVCGMTLDMGLNGKRGKVLGFTTKIFTWIEGESHAIDSYNINVLETSTSQPTHKNGSCVRVKNLAINTTLNDQKGIVKGTQQTAFIAIDSVGIRCFQTSDLQPMSGNTNINKGDTVTIRRLLLEPELNGKTGVVKSTGYKVFFFSFFFFFEQSFSPRQTFEQLVCR